MRQLSLQILIAPVNSTLLCAKWKDGRRLLQAQSCNMLQESALGSQPLCTRIEKGMHAG